MGSMPNGKDSDIRKVLLLGINRLASSILSGLLPNNDSNPTFEVHQAVHQQSSSRTTVDLTIHRTNFAATSLASLFSEITPDVVFSTFSGGLLETQRSVIDTAVSAGIRRFVPAEFGQDSQNQALQGRPPPLKGRSQLLAYLEELSKNDKIQWLAVATGVQLDQALISGEEQFAGISKSWNGTVSRAILQHWAHVKNQYLYASGLITTAHACLEALQSTTGQNWKRGNHDVEDMVREAEQRFHRGFPDAGVFLLEKSVLCDDSLGAVKPFRERDVKCTLGLEGEDLTVLVTGTVYDFKHHGKGDCGCG